MATSIWLNISPAFLTVEYSASNTKIMGLIPRECIDLIKCILNTMQVGLGIIFIFSIPIPLLLVSLQDESVFLNEPLEE